MYYHPPKKNKKQLTLYTVIASILLFLSLSWWIFHAKKPEGALATAQAITLPAPQLAKDSVPPPKEDQNQQNTLRTVNLTIQAGDTLSELFEKAGLSQAVLIQLLSDISHKEWLNRIKPNLKFHFGFNGDTLQSLSFDPSPQKRLQIDLIKDSYHSQLITLTAQKQQHYLTAAIENSLYATGNKYHIPHKLLVQLTHIFGKEINFAKDLRDNDQLTILYETRQVENKPKTIGKILAASLTNRNHKHIALQYEKPDPNLDYYSPEGKSLRLSFDRYPIRFSHVGSSFDLHRLHPILHINRPHKGIDLAARHGTPIHAVADGKIIHIGTGSGYGKMVKIKHSKKYETIYAHMSRFKTGLKNGTRVKRGQVIGYVGQTGLATAPHCHFEFRVFGKAMDPARVSLPKADAIKNRDLKQFKAKTQPWIEQLALYENANKDNPYSTLNE